MRQTSKKNWSGNWRQRAVLSLSLISVASLTGCATWLEEFRAMEEANRQVAVAKAQPGSNSLKLPDLPAALKTCLLKRSCQAAASEAKSAGKPAPECTTADGIVVSYVQNEREKLSCAATLMAWYRKQQDIQAAAAREAGHPKTGKPAKGASWQ